MQDKYLKLFANCIITKGATRAALCDLQRNQIETLPIDLIEVIENLEIETIAETIHKYGEENRETIEEYIDLLLKNEYAFLCDKVDKDRFPKLSMEWDEPTIISNVIIDIKDNFKMLDFPKIFKELEDLHCLCIQFRFFSKVELSFIDNMLELLQYSTILNIELLLQFDEKYTKEDYIKILEKNLRVSKCLIVNSNTEERYDSKKNETISINFIKEQIESAACCGVISKNYFILSIPVFTESQLHNTCLNRKISIDIDGEIKNCPSMTKSYGNIKNTTLQEAINKEGFKDMWYIHKDQIEVCKDCEFRHICTDCRAYLKDPNNIYSKPAKCSYDPYLATWENENSSNNQLFGK